MRQADWNDKEKVVKIITTTFHANPGVNWMLKSPNSQRHLSRLATYAFIKAYNRKGVFISTNEKGVALCFKPNQRVISAREFIYELFFAFTSIGITRITKVLRREAVRKSLRPSSGNYLYFWFLGVLPGGNGAGFELKNAMFQEARDQKVPLYLETSVQRNQTVYEREGFKTYHEWIDEKENIHFWFMKWEPPMIGKQQ